MRQVREPVRFADAMEWLKAQGVTGFLEVGPHPSLVPNGLMRRHDDSVERLFSALGRLWADGAVDWNPPVGSRARGCPRTPSSTSTTGCTPAPPRRP